MRTPLYDMVQICESEYCGLSTDGCNHHNLMPVGQRCTFILFRLRIIDTVCLTTVFLILDKQGATLDTDGCTVIIIVINDLFPFRVIIF